MTGALTYHTSGYSQFVIASKPGIQPFKLLVNMLPVKDLQLRRYVTHLNVSSAEPSAKTSHCVGAAAEVAGSTYLHAHCLVARIHMLSDDKQTRCSSLAVIPYGR